MNVMHIQGMNQNSSVVSSDFLQRKTNVGR